MYRYAGLTDFAQRAAEVVKEITGGGLDHLINNAAVVSSKSEFKTFSDL